MSYASENLHKGFLRRKMPHIVSKVKVREIIIHLPCLTDHDRETIEAKRETNGNFDGMVLLLECLKRRENWPEQLIDALEACEQPTIAAEIRAEYNTLRGINNSNPSPPSTTVVSAHVHPPPSPSQLPVSDGSQKGPVTDNLSAKALAPTQPVAPPEKLVQPQVIEGPAVKFPKVISLPEPVSEPPESTQIDVAPLPSTPPPSPEIPHTPTRPVLPQREVNTHQEPEENSEPDLQDVSGVIPDQENAGNGKVNSVVPPPPSGPVKQSETDPLPDSASPQTTITEVKPQQSPSPTQTRSDVNDRLSFNKQTPEKPPVQDTTPPVEKVPAIVLEPEETSEPHTAQVFDSSRQTETPPASSLPAAAVMEASLFDESTVCLSKPGELVSIQPQNDGGANILATNSGTVPYSGNSDRLEFSDGAQDTVTSASDVTSIISSAVSGAPYQENGIALSHNEPEENHYESPSQSVAMQEVREHVLHVSEEVSILNLDGQATAAQDRIINSETAKEIPSASPFSFTIAQCVTSVNARSSESYHPCDPAPAKTSSQLPDPVQNKAPGFLTENKYILTAAGVGVVALLMAWKLKN